MKSRHPVTYLGASLAALAAATAVVQTPAAVAQTTAESPAAKSSASTPPAGGSGSYSTPQSSAAQAYADQYARWAQQNCIDQRTGNTAAGAIIGGALGALTGAAITGGRAAGAVAGGAVGVVTGAAIGSNAPASCPPGFIVRAGAPPFVYAGPYYDPGAVWYQPWVWVDGRWVYEPYPYAYWVGPAYWRGPWFGRPWVVRHRP